MKISKAKFATPVTVKGALYHYIDAALRKFEIVLDAKTQIVSIVDDKKQLTITPFSNVVWAQCEEKQ